MPNGSITNPAQDVHKDEGAGSFTQKTLNQSNGNLDTTKIIIQN